jgi:hypothetical protein
MWRSIMSRPYCFSMCSLEYEGSAEEQARYLLRTVRVGGSVGDDAAVAARL